MNDIKVPVITVDGPGGTGKGTVCLKIAQHLQWHYLDSGAVYRTFAWLVKEQSIDSKDLASLLQVAQALDISIQCDQDGYRVLHQERDISTEIFSADMAIMASQLSSHPDIRQALLAQQLAFRRLPGLVTDGRDMGTVIFPDALLKVYLDARPEVRARRRMKQLEEAGEVVDFASLLADIQMRDRRDSERTCAPLKPAEDAIIIDSSDITVQIVMQKILTELHQRLS